VCLFVTTLQIFFFVSRWKSSHFLAVSSPCAPLQNVTLFFDFWFRPPNAQNLLPKMCTKSSISRLVWQIDLICLGLPWVFGDGWTMQNVAGPTFVAIATKFGLFLHKITYKLACMADKPEMFGPTRGFSGMADSMEPCKMLLGRPLLPWQWNLG